MISIHEMLKKSSELYRNKEGFVFKNKRYTFREIEEASSKVAAFLASMEVKAGDRVGIFSSKNIEEIIAIFAVLKIGCIFVHINPHFKEDQVSHVIKDCDIKVILVHESKMNILKKTGLINDYMKFLIGLSKNLEIEQQHKLFSLNRIINETSIDVEIYNESNENDPAAIIYTSGSTGKPKGIIVTHKIFYDATVTSAKVLENNKDDRIISITPFSFDGALSQLFTSVFVGATLVLQESLFPKDIVSTMLNERITGFHGVPSFWRMMLQKHSPFANFEYPDLRYVSIIGEVFPHNELMRLKSILSKTKFFMMYGTTEAFRSTCLPAEDFEKKLPSIGKPLPGVKITIVGDSGQACGIGEIGEIVHKGAFVSPGYWNNPKKTYEVFRNGAVYTGDLGMIDDEGYLYFIGRKDTMIKSMGYRMSPDEIEECLCKMPGIIEAAAISVETNEQKNKIKVVVVPSAEIVLTCNDIVNYCKEHLPYYMVPGIIEFRKELPKTSTFKINRSQLS